MRLLAISLGATSWGTKNTLSKPSGAYPRSDVQFSREAKAIAMQWLTPEEYSSLPRESGFSQVETVQDLVMLSPDGLWDLGHYWLFIRRLCRECH
jgi:hypothetical protein